jgi:hypothetical protein
MNKRLLILGSILGAMLCAHSFMLSARGGHGHGRHHGGYHRGDSFLPAAGGAFVGSMAATAVMRPRETVVVTPTQTAAPDTSYLQAQINQQNYKIASMELKINSQDARIAALERKVK